LENVETATPVMNWRISTKARQGAASNRAVSSALLAAHAMRASEKNSTCWSTISTAQA
jgi:hypothetical protein